MANARKYTVGLVQMRMGADPEANFAAALERIEEAARLGAKIVCLPELFRTQYFCQREELALFDISRGDPRSVNRLGWPRLARKLRVVLRRLAL